MLTIGVVAAIAFLIWGGVLATRCPQPETRRPFSWMKGCATTLLALIVLGIVAVFVAVLWAETPHPTPSRTPVSSVAPSPTPAPLIQLPERMLAPGLTCWAKDRKGRIVKRSAARKRLFWRMSGFPNGRPGMYGDHIVPLDCGGCDVPSNMQWLTEAEWKAKTSWERKPCSAWWDGTNVVRTR